MVSESSRARPAASVDALRADLAETRLHVHDLERELEETRAALRDAERRLAAGQGSSSVDEAVARSLETQGAQRDLIERLTNIDKLPKLRVLYMSNNKLENFKELDKLAGLASLQELLLVGNPLHASAEKPDELGCEYRIEVLKRVPQLVKLDGIPVDVDEREAAKKALEEPEE